MNGAWHIRGRSGNEGDGRVGDQGNRNQNSLQSRRLPCGENPDVPRFLETKRDKKRIPAKCYRFCNYV